MLSQRQCGQIKAIKEKVDAMLHERRGLSGRDADLPSRYWADFCKYFEYMLTLPEPSFDQLRVHTYHLTGDHYQRYYFGMGPLTVSETYLQKLDSEVPPQFLLDEPENGIGYRRPNGRFVSMDVARYQEVVNGLFRSGVIPFSRKDGDRIFVLEIGGGYGGLGHHLSRILEPITYVIVDLPETLLFSAAYLTLQNPGKTVFLYDGSDVLSKSRDFILIPNYRLDLLRRLRFRLAINVLSFQEMRKEQVERYLDFAAETSELLYSFNQARNEFNFELSDLNQLLKEKFAITGTFDFPRKKGRLAWPLKIKKLRSMLRTFYQKARKRDLGFKEYLCRPIVKRNPE